MEDIKAYFSKTPIQRIHEKIKRDLRTGCWEWRGTKTTGPDGGYAQITHHGKTRYVHRLLFEYYKQFIPAGMVIDHICRVRSCVNPDHMRVVTVRQNALENNNGPAAINAKKKFCVHGHNEWWATKKGTRACAVCGRAATKRWEKNNK